MCRSVATKTGTIKLKGDERRFDWLQRSLEEHQQYSSPVLDWKQTSCNSEDQVRSLQCGKHQHPDHQHVEDEAASEDCGVAAPPLRGHELAVKVEYRWRLRDLDTGVTTAAHHGVRQGGLQSGETSSVSPHIF